jgi:endonuclease/exonuclease/phosphatase family metal-dependent hydrolase
MTWNIQRGQAQTGRLSPADMAPYAARVSANRADVVGLQEVTREQAAAITDLLGWPAARYVETKNPCPGYPPPAPAACVPFGNAILSRHPLGEAVHWSLPPSSLETGVEERVLLRSVVDAAGRSVSVYVTHLASSATTGERETQVREVLALIEDDGRAVGDPFRPVLLGDFNASPGSDAIGLVTEEFVDAWGEVGGGEPGFTSNAVLGLSRRIDDVFVGRSSGLRPTGVSVDSEVLSDHLAVVAELRS